MSATFVGETAFTLQPGSTLTVDAWGMDTLVRKYRGAPSKLAAFLLPYAKSRTVADSTYPWLSHQGHTVDFDRSYATVTITYKGIQANASMAGIGLEPIRETSLRTQDVQLQYIGDTLGESTGAVADITYVAPSTTIRYVRRGRPRKQTFKGELELTDEAISVVSRRGFPGNIHLVAGLSWGKVMRDNKATWAAPEGTLQAYNGVVEVITTEFSFKPAGLWYECVETNEARIVPLDLANGLINYLIK